MVDQQRDRTVPVVVPGARTEVLSSFIWHGKRFRIIWNRLYWFPPDQTFHQFLDYLLVHTLNGEWLRKQSSLTAAEQHVVVRWRTALLDLVRTAPTTPDGGWVRTGPIQAYLSLAYDLYWLQIVNKLPRSLRSRLRNKEAFQGARYEVLVAAAFARAGFGVELLDESIKAAKHCEFIATHKKTGSMVYVEAKSRHRHGVLHQPGTFDHSSGVRADLFRLYSRAVDQGPSEAHPFLIFIDANLPMEPGVPLDKIPWVREFDEGLMKRRMAERGVTAETAVLVTNFAPHFGNETDAAPPAFCLLSPSPKPRAPLEDSQMLDDLMYCLRYSYDGIPRQL
jgi:hypothetical protein